MNAKQLRAIMRKVEAKRAEIAAINEAEARIKHVDWLNSLSRADFAAYYAELERADPVGMAALSRMTDAELIAIIRKGGK